MGFKPVSMLAAAACILSAIMAMPEPTPAAKLEHRQASVSGITNVYSPSIINGVTVTWQSFSFVISSGTRTLISSNQNWGWCATTTSNCALPTTCSNGTVYFSGSSTVACATDNPLCGTELLLSTSGASSRLTRHACFPTSDAGKLTSIYLLTPPASQVSSSSSGSSSSSQLPTPVPVNDDDGSKTNVGAIVGGVVGGLAVLVIAILGIFFLLRHRKKQHNAAAAAAAGATTNGAPGSSPYGGAAAMAQHPQPGAGYYQPGAGSPEVYNAKHASFVDYPAGSPPPQYGNMTPGQQNYYPPPGASPHPDGYSVAGTSPGQTYGTPVAGQVPANASYGAHELPAQSVPANSGAVELDTTKH